MASELKVNKISPESGTTLTLGDSGDTINFGSGVLPNFENLTVTGDLTVDTNSLKVDSTNNFVGIGTATPSVALDVVGAITATGNITGTLATAAQPNITSVGTLSSLSVSGNITGTLATAAQPNITSVGTLSSLSVSGNITGTLATAAQPNITSVGTLTSATISGDLTVDTSTLHVDSSNNRVGIGTTSPSQKLEVVGGNGDQFTLDNTGQSLTQAYWNNNGTNKGAIWAKTDEFTMYGYSGVHMRFYTNASERMRIDSSGNVGIKNSSPSHTLDISDTSTTAKTLRVGQSGGASNADATMIISNGGTGDAMLRFDYEGSNTDRARIGVTSSSQSLKFYTGGNNQRMVIDNTGKVGIGTSSPDRELTVGNVANARIGILSSDNTTGASQLQFGDPDNSQIGRIYYEHSDNSMRFHTNNTEWMRIESNGQVGIGTTSADAKLHVANGNAATQFKLEHTSATNNAVFGVDSTSNLRIYIGGTHKLNIDPGGHIIPQASNSYDLGSSTRVWRNIYTSDFHMTNEGLDKGNDIDGTKGSWTFQEGENDLFLINNKNGKKYKFNLTEIV